MTNKQKGYIEGLELILAYLTILAILTPIVIGVSIWSSKKFLIPEKIWNETPSFVTDAKMNNFYFLGEDKYDTDSWSYTEMTNGDILINPFETHLVCYIKSLPNVSDAINNVSTKEIIQAKQNQSLLRVKPMMVAWQNNDSAQKHLKNCPGVDVSDDYIFYQGHRVVELVNVEKDNSHATHLSIK